MKKTLILFAISMFGIAATFVKPPKCDITITTNGTPTHQTVNGTCADWKADHPNVPTTNVKCCNVGPDDNWTGEGGINCPHGRVTKGNHSNFYNVNGNFYVGRTFDGYLTAVEIDGYDTSYRAVHDIFDSYSEDHYAAFFQKDAINELLHVYLSDTTADWPYYDTVTNTHLIFDEDFVNYAVNPHEAISFGPNPFTNSITVYYSELSLTLFGPLTIRLYDNSLNLVDEYPGVTGSSYLIPTSTLANGNYFLQVYSASDELLKSETVVKVSSIE